MKKNRYLLCLLACGVMLYYGVPELHAFDGGLAGWFSVTWLMLALFVMLGNVAGILYMPRRVATSAHKLAKKPTRERLRSY